MSDGAHYTEQFFRNQAERSLASARVIAPHVMDLLRPSKIVDVGCGVGAWLKAFHDLGVQTFRGMDGDYVSREQLLFDAQSFQPCNLARPEPIVTGYDLCLCLEVAEHIPARASRSLIKMLVSAAPLVLFSAAIPGQGGTSHVNEQWPRYWTRLFEERGYLRLDPFRRIIANDEGVDWWYRQNLYLFASAESIKESAILRRELELARMSQIDYIGINVLAKYSTVRGLATQFSRAVWRAIRGRVC